MICTIKQLLLEKMEGYQNENSFLIPYNQQEEIKSLINDEINRLKISGFELEYIKLQDKKLDTGKNTNFNDKITKTRVVFDPNVEPNYLTFLENLYSEMLLSQQREQQEIENYLIQSGQSEENWRNLNNYDEKDYSEIKGQMFFSPIVNNPVNFAEWKNNREQIIAKLEDLSNRYRKTKEKLKLKQVNKAIKDLKEQLKKVNDKDVNILHESLINEIKILDNLLTLIKEDTSTGLDSLEANDIKQRINDLSMYFLGHDIEGNNFSKTLRDLLENTFPDDISKIRDDINTLIKKYNDSTKEIIISIFEDDSLVKEHKKSMSDQEWEDFHNNILNIIEENKQSDRIGTEKNFLSAKQVNSVLSDLLISLRDTNYMKEVGQTQQLMQDLRESWLKIMNLTNIQGEKLTNKLYKKDIFGIMTNNIISIYNENFNKILKYISNYRSLFYQKQNDNSYKNWMKNFKNNVDIIEPYKLKAFYHLYKNNPIYNEFFTYSEKEMEDYEKELREKLGNTIFDIELSKQLESIKNYTFEYENNLLGSVMDKYQKNPMIFIKHFYSDNFDKIDESTGLFLEPTYTSYFPKNEINQEIKKIESEEYGSELLEFWKIATKLERYANPIFQSEKIYVKNNELINEKDVFAEINNSEATKQVKFFKKIPLWFKTGIQNWLENFAKNQDNRTKNDLVLNYSSYNKKEINQIKNYYKSKSLDELYDIAKNKGLDLSKLDNIAFDELSETIASSLAQIEMNKSIKYNMFDSLLKMVELARNINTRRASVSMFDLMMDYNKQSRPDVNDNIERDFLTAWYNLNIKGENFGKNFVFVKFRNKTLGTIKNTAEKQLDNFLQNEKKNALGEYNFNFAGLNYQKINDKYFEIDGPDMEEITKEKIDERYDTYINSFLQDLGTEFTPGTVALALKSNMSKAAMAGLKIPGGITNRLAGMTQNMNMAITEEAGYNIEQYQYARRFMMFNNTNKYLTKLGNVTKLIKLLNPTERRKAKKLETLKMFATNLHLLESVLNDLKIEGDSINTITNDIMDMMFDFSINNPEWKNQMELLLSIMQTVTIKDKNGVEVPIFDGKTQEFIWIPGTLQLKDEFKTEDNINNWEEFKEDVNGNAPQRLLVARYKTAKMSAQGNYANDDKIILENTVSGKLTTMYVKWLAGNSYRQFGSKDFDISTGKIKYEGNKRILAKHAPTLSLYLALVQGNNTVTFASGVFAGIVGLSSIWALGTGIATLGGVFATFKMLGVFNKRSDFRRNPKNTFKNIMHQFKEKEELYLALSFAEEIAKRSINILPQYFYMSGPIKEEKIKAKNYKYKPQGMTKEERDLLSASAMDVSQKLGIFLASSLASVLVAGIFLLASDDDEEELVKDASTLEYLLNMIINMKNNMYKDINKYSNPFTFNDAASSFAYFNTIDEIRRDILFNEENSKSTSWTKYTEGKITKEELNSKLAVHASKLTGFPTQFAKLLTDDEAILIGDKKARFTKDWFDKILMEKEQSPEENYKEIVENERKLISERVKSRIREIYSEKGNDNLDEETVNELKDVFFEKQGLIKKRNTKTKKYTYEELYKSGVFNNIDNAIENMNENDLQKERRIKKEKSESSEFSAE